MNKKKHQPVDWDESFGMSMEEFDQAISGSSISDDVKPGDKVTGKIIALSEHSVFIDLNAKSEGIIPLEEFVDEHGELTIKPGDIITATVVFADDEIRLSHRMRKKDQSLEMLQEAFAGKIPVEGRVENTNKGGFEISVGDLNAFCPISQIDLDYVEDPRRYIGASYHFYITQMDRSGRNIVVSRSKLLNDERQKIARETLRNLSTGDIVTGRVRRIADFGVFVDIGGIDGLVHISRISWDHLNHPSDSVSIDQEVQVKVLSINPETGQISLSMRDAAEAPWDAYVGTEIIEGHTYTGQVMRLETFGAFVRLKPGLEGLLHISEMDWDRRIKHPSDKLKTGDTVQVKVTGIDTENHRISLSLKQAEPDPWENLSGSADKTTLFAGTITSILPRGLEVRLQNGVTGFVPLSKTGIGHEENLRDRFSANQSVDTRIVEIDSDRRNLILEIVDRKTEEHDHDITQYLADANTRTSTGFGSLRARLQKAIDKKQQPL
jgi:small subunit ribosomal protein S1